MHRSSSGFVADFDGSPLTIECKYAHNLMEEVSPVGWELDGFSNRDNKISKNNFDGFPCNIALENLLG